MKTDKKALLEYAEKNGWRYPKNYVWAMYSCYGGAIGGYLLCMLMLSEKAISGINFLSLVGNIFGLVIFSFIGAFVGVALGFIPATLTGFCVANCKIVISNLTDYLKLFIVGGLITLIFGLIWFFFNDKVDVFKDFNFYLGTIILGGLTSMICGRLFLPKLPKDF